MKNKKWMKYVIIIVGVIGFILVIWFGFFRGGTLANSNPFIKNTLFSTLKVDEDAYGDTDFDSSDFKFRTILDDKLEDYLDNVIYISFFVGGDKDNNAEEPVYDIALQDLDIDCNLLSPYVKWKLKKNGEEFSSGSLDYQFDTIVDGRLVLTPIQQDLVPYNEDKSKYDYYEFYLWLSDSCQESDISKCRGAVSQDNLIGKKLSGKIEVELYSKSKKALVRNPSSSLDESTCIKN